MKKDNILTHLEADRIAGLVDTGHDGDRIASVIVSRRVPDRYTDVRKQVAEIMHEGKVPK